MILYHYRLSLGTTHFFHLYKHLDVYTDDVLFCSEKLILSPPPLLEKIGHIALHMLGCQSPTNSAAYNWRKLNPPNKLQIWIGNNLQIIPISRQAIG